jgi:hypothetical protein
MTRDAAVQPVRANITELLRSLQRAARALRFRLSISFAKVAHSAPDTPVRLACEESGSHGSFRMTEITPVTADGSVRFCRVSLGARGYRAGWKRRSRRLLDTTNTELNAIAAAAMSGLRNPSAASGMAAAL